MPNYSKSDKKRCLTLTYFGTTDSRDDDVNPHTDVGQFMSDNVGSLRWGIDPDARKRSKQRFADTYSHVLDYYHVQLSYNDILTEVLNDDQTNEEAVDTWVSKAIFPKKP